MPDNETPPEIITPAQIKTEKFTDNLIKTKGNAKEAYVKTYPNAKESSAYELGSRKLRKVDTQKSLMRKLGSESKTARVIKQAIEETIKPATIKWSEVHSFVETDLKLRGYLKDKDDKQANNIAIIITKD